MADIAKFIEEIKGMTVVELNELVKALEEEFGVSATPVAVAAGPAAGAAPAHPRAAGGAPRWCRPAGLPAQLTGFSRLRISPLLIQQHEETRLGWFA